MLSPARCVPGSTELAEVSEWAICLAGLLLLPEAQGQQAQARSQGQQERRLRDRARDDGAEATASAVSALPSRRRPFFCRAGALIARRIRWRRRREPAA